jgi:hypothetical protein
MNPKNNRRRGKASQAKIAKIINGINIGTLGGEDILHEKFSIEVKSVSKCVIYKWMEQCEKNNKRKKIPCVIVHLKNTKHESSDLVIFKLKDVINIFKGESK